jgi:hypothetical protein
MMCVIVNEILDRTYLEVVIAVAVRKEITLLPWRRAHTANLYEAELSYHLCHYVAPQVYHVV